MDSHGIMGDLFDAELSDTSQNKPGMSEDEFKVNTEKKHSENENNCVEWDKWQLNGRQSNRRKT
eukprot:8451280-Ditylum_brightwellii.AAC.1